MSQPSAESSRADERADAAQGLQPGPEVGGRQARIADAVDRRRQRLQQRRREPTPWAEESDEDRQRRIEQQRQALELRRQQRFAAAGLSADQLSRIGGLGEARRTWSVEHREEMQALRAEMLAARQSGEEAAVETVRTRIQALRATAPTMGNILAELSDEQRAQIRAGQPWPRQPSPASDTSAGSEGAPNELPAD
jgi:hypothetical protein